jgi:hypothetical protein
MRLRNSFWSMLGRDTSEAPELVVERIRTAMLKALIQRRMEDHIALHMRIRFARDLDALWYLRPDLMTAMSACHGESAARVALTEITGMFRGHHRGAGQSRFGAL